MKRVRFSSSAPGSHGEVKLDVTPQELEAIQRLVQKFNRVNTGHAAPFFKIQETALSRVISTLDENLVGDTGENKS